MAESCVSRVRRPRSLELGEWSHFNVHSMFKRLAQYSTVILLAYLKDGFQHFHQPESEQTIIQTEHRQFLSILQLWQRSTQQPSANLCHLESVFSLWYPCLGNDRKAKRSIVSGPLSDTMELLWWWSAADWYKCRLPQNLQTPFWEFWKEHEESGTHAVRKHEYQNGLNWLINSLNR